MHQNLYKRDPKREQFKVWKENISDNNIGYKYRIKISETKTEKTIKQKYCIKLSDKNIG